MGAPYDGEDGRGAIYIFNGGKNGINTNYSQVSCLDFFLKFNTNCDALVFNSGFLNFNK